jgi:thiol-disulfide isomerase/thioredoxin
MNQVKSIVYGVVAMLMTSAFALNASDIALKLQDQVNSKQQKVVEPKVNLPKEVAPIGSDTAIGQLAKNDYVLVLFIDSKCSHCINFAPVVDKFSKEYGFKVYPLSFDGKPVYPYKLAGFVTPELKNIYFGDPTAKTVTPTLFLQNTKNLKFYMIANGETDKHTLEVIMNRYAKELNKHG